MTRKYRLLIVDDIFVNRFLLVEIVKKISEFYAEAQNGKEAIELLYKHDFDVILMDIEMPIMNGLEATRYIRSKLPAPKCDTPIIALTAHNPATFFEDFSDAGFNQLMTKPYSVEKVLKLIEETCEAKEPH